MDINELRRIRRRMDEVKKANKELRPENRLRLRPESDIEGEDVFTLRLVPDENGQLRSKIVQRHSVVDHATGNWRFYLCNFREGEPGGRGRSCMTCAYAAFVKSEGDDPKMYLVETAGFLAAIRREDTIVLPKVVTPTSAQLEGFLYWLDKKGLEYFLDPYEGHDFIVTFYDIRGRFYKTRINVDPNPSPLGTEEEIERFVRIASGLDEQFEHLTNEEQAKILGCGPFAKNILSMFDPARDLVEQEAPNEISAREDEGAINYEDMTEIGVDEEDETDNYPTEVDPELMEEVESELVRPEEDSNPKPGKRLKLKSPLKREDLQKPSKRGSGSKSSQTRQSAKRLKLQPLSKKLTQIAKKSGNR